MQALFYFYYTIYRFYYTIYESWNEYYFQETGTNETGSFLISSAFITRCK